MDNKLYDVAIIGAGASGLVAAIRCGRLGLRTLLLDSQKKCGAKILMSGGSRCNATNRSVTEKDFASENSRFVRNILRAFSAEKTFSFFEDLEVNLILEEGGKYFPSTHSGKTILAAFLNEIKKLPVELKTNFKVETISAKKNIFTVKSATGFFTAKTVVLSTGGLSYPATGSDGSGYKIAKRFGHRIIPTLPALTPLTTKDSAWKSISGVALDTRLSLLRRNEKTISFEDSLLFTHFGFSGPVVLNISRYWLRFKDFQDARIVANFIPSFSPETLQTDLRRTALNHPTWTLKRYLKQFLPERLGELIATKSKLSSKKTLGQLQKIERAALIQNLVACPLDIAGSLGFEKAEVTSGGVDLAEINHASLESKKQPGLFFAGEMLDVDGRIGGFNFQWAWSSAHVAANGVKKHLG